MKVKDKVIIVTGGGNGLGRELVITILRKGGKAVAVDINSHVLHSNIGLIQHAFVLW